MPTEKGPITAILGAITRLGESDAKAIAVEAGVAYSTTAKKLRGLAADGRVLRRDNDAGAALWRAAPAGTNPGPVNTQNTNHLAATPSAAATTRPDLDPAPESTSSIPDSPTSQVDAHTEPIHSEPANDHDAEPRGDEPATTDQQDDTTDYTPTPEPGAAQPIADTEAAPNSETSPNEPTPDSSGPDSSRQTNAASTTSEPGADATAVTEDPDDSHVGTTSTAGSESAETVAKPRRRKGQLRSEVLAVMQNNPDSDYKVGQLSKQLDNASQGAITNALHKLVTDGNVTQTGEGRHTTYKAH